MSPVPPANRFDPIVEVGVFGCVLWGLMMVAGIGVDLFSRLGG